MGVRRYNPQYTPPATIVLVALNVLVAVADIATDGWIERFSWGRGIDLQYGEYWRLFTCAWVHADIMHIAFNIYGIYILGVIFERLHGWKPLVIIYLVSLFGGSALALAFMDPARPLVGASGAAYGLFGAVLGYFYARTGSIRQMTQIPMARMLLIWLAFGIFMSTRPNVSLLGHLGGFIPGLILGMFFEHRYRRELDLYHILGTALVCFGIASLAAFACAPFTRSTWYATRAMHAYEAGELAKGDELMDTAKTKRQSSEGASALMTHIDTWRTGHSIYPQEFTTDVLRWALTHPDKISEGGGFGRPFHFLPPLPDAEPAESLEPAPAHD